MKFSSVIQQKSLLFFFVLFVLFSSKSAFAGVPTLSSAKFTGDSEITIVFNEAVNAVSGDFTNIETGSGNADLSVLGISGSGTDTITLTLNESLGDASLNTGEIDIAGTVTSVSSAESFAGATDQAITDGQVPTIQSALLTTNGYESAVAKSGDTATFFINYAEAVSVTSVGSASTATNASTLSTEVSATNSSSSQIVFTIAGGDNGDISINSVNFTIEDANGNSSVITSLGTVSGSVTADTTAPVFDEVQFTDSAGSKTYLKEGDSIQISLFVDPADTWRTGNNLEFSIGAKTGISSGNFTKDNDNQTSRNKTYTVLAGENGDIQVTALTFLDRAGNSITGFSNPYTPTTTVVVDTTVPVITINDDVSGTITNSESMQITITDTNPDTSTYEYGFSADNTCDAGDTYGNSFSSSVAFTITTEAQSGNYVCIKAEDLAGNISYAVSANTLDIDTTQPDITITDDEAGTATPAGGDVIFTFTFTEDMTGFDATDITVSGGTKGTFSTTNASTYTLAVTPNSDSETNITVDVASASATDSAGNGNTIATQAVQAVDTLAPSISSVVAASNNANTAYAKDGETATYSITYSEAVTVSGVTTSTAANITNAVTTEVNAAAESTDELIFTIASGDNGVIDPAVNYTITDANGNAANISSLGVITGTVTADNTAPEISATTATTNNALNNTLAKDGETVTYAITYSEAVTVSGVTTSTATNIATAVTTEVNAAAESTDELIFTIASGDNGDVTPTVSYSITDLAGNAASITSLTGLAGTITADTTAPTFTSASIENGTPTQITVVFSENIEITNSTGNTITAASLARTVDGAVTGSSTSNITYTLSSDVFESGQIVTYAYDSGTGNITDSAGNALASISATQASNNIVEGSPILSNILLTPSSANPSSQASITWDTQDNVNGVGTGALNTSSNEIEYGTDQTLGLTQSSSTGDGVSTHSATLSSLSSNTTYYYRIKSVANGKTSSSQIFSFTTSRGDDGVYTDSTNLMQSSAEYSAVTPYSSGWHFRFNITIDSVSENFLRFKFDNWASGENALATSGNVKMLVSSTGSSADEATIDAGTSISTTYTDGTTVDISGIADGNPNLAGKQISLDLYIKIPDGQAAGSYSSSYGVKTLSADTGW